MDGKTIAIALPVGVAIIVATILGGRWYASWQSPAVLVVSTVFEPQSRSAGEVIVEATPIELTVGKGPKFSLAFDTHSGSLDFDVAKVAILTDAQGNTQTLAVWEGDPPGGHHRKGKLTFAKPLANGGPIKLQIVNIVGGEGVDFSWKI